MLGPGSLSHGWEGYRGLARPSAKLGTMRHSDIVVPHYNQDGSTTWENEQPDIGQRIREGDATLGWLGDPLLELRAHPHYIDADNVDRGTRWEVWRHHEDGEPTLVASKFGKLNGEQLIRNLAAHDTRTHDIATELIAARDARLEALKRDAADENAGIADKLAWALGKDLGAPAQSGRVFATGR